MFLDSPEHPMPRLLVRSARALTIVAVAGFALLLDRGTFVRNPGETRQHEIAGVGSARVPTIALPRW
jgi:hypothetical protein